MSQSGSGITYGIRLAAILLFTATGLAAQTVRGVVTEEGTGTPLQGALVLLVAPQGDSSSIGVLTDAAGEFVLSAPPGRWRVRADRIGHRSVHSAPFRVAAGDELYIPLESPVEAVSLAALQVSTASRGCSRGPGRGDAVATIWNEARKALESVYWAREQDLVRFETVVYQRDLDPKTLEVRAEQSERRDASGRRPFSSLDPLLLADRGYVQQTDSGTYYFAPDEQVLLSSVFLDGHCFSLRSAPAQPDLIGLAFEPLGRGRQVDIAGLLWLDAATHELRFLEFRYADIPLDVDTHNLGGRVDFQRLPSGAWIPRRWWIRMPEIEIRNIRRLGLALDRQVLTGIRERGGEVLAVETRGRGRIENLDRPRVQGTVYDSTRAGPLARAEVFLVGTDLAARTDEHGRFLLSSGSGDYQLAFRHPRLDSLGFHPPSTPISMREGVVRQVRLAVPSQRSIVASACREPGGAVVGGIVRDGHGRSVPTARVLLAWRSMVGQISERVAETNSRGHFAFCDAPTGTPLFARAVHDGLTSEPVDTEAEPTGVGWTELRIDTLRTGRLAGRVTDQATGAPVADATIHVRRTGLTTRTDSDGAFLLAGGPQGARVLEVEHIAYGVRSETFRIRADSTVSLHVAMTADAIVLEPLNVTVTRRYTSPGLDGFYARLGGAQGRFVTAEQIDQRKPGQLSDILREVPGLEVNCGMASVVSSGCMIRFERAQALGQTCPVQFFLDGSSVSKEMVETMRPEEIAGIEVYNGLSGVPPAFRRGRDTRCGVVAVWLKARP